ncbi:hypothetical protein WISP_142092 [Willisornis vidua]|uniref:Uncharacterized protein n=1 Tax=Willisornis vidua TaxID=1566151 RepID=A0ABQ9CLT0_9PASS|nr:hypothetical protein WISP_142092 [Willisornis vidua]
MMLLELITFHKCKLFSGFVIFLNAICESISWSEESAAEALVSWVFQQVANWVCYQRCSFAMQKFEAWAILLLTDVADEMMSSPLSLGLMEPGCKRASLDYKRRPRSSSGRQGNLGEEKTLINDQESTSFLEQEGKLAMPVMVVVDFYPQSSGCQGYLKRQEPRKSPEGYLTSGDHGHSESSTVIDPFIPSMCSKKSHFKLWSGVSKHNEVPLPLTFNRNSQMHKVQVLVFALRIFSIQAVMSKMRPDAASAQRLVFRELI